jgi:hypothetical protein
MEKEYQDKIWEARLKSMEEARDWWNALIEPNQKADLPTPGE